MKHAVGILLTDESNTGIWLCERIAESDPFVGYYATPGGGVEENETTVQAIIRELGEETGIWWDGVNKLSLLTTGEFKKPDGTAYVAHHFILKTGLTPQNTEDKKHGPWILFQWGELNDLRLMPSTIDAIEMARRLGHTNEQDKLHG